MTDTAGCNLDVNSGIIEEMDYVSSVSRCESERGTYGRGTPPTREAGQPRLDELLWKIQVCCVVCTSYWQSYLLPLIDR